MLGNGLNGIEAELANQSQLIAVLLVWYFRAVADITAGGCAQCYAETMTVTPHPKHEKIHTFLYHHPMAVLSTVAADGTPWGAAIYYVADDGFNFFFVTRTETYKYQNLDAHPVAAITVADNDSQTTVQASGEISRVPIQDYMDIFIDKLAKIRPEGDHDWAPPLHKIHEGEYMPLCLTPSRLQYADYGHKKVAHDADYIEKIIPA